MSSFTTTLFVFRIYVEEGGGGQGGATNFYNDVCLI